MSDDVLKRVSGGERRWDLFEVVDDVDVVNVVVNVVVDACRDMFEVTLVILIPFLTLKFKHLESS
jgi:hypothetical protein